MLALSRNNMEVGIDLEIEFRIHITCLELLSFIFFGIYDIPFIHIGFLLLTAIDISALLISLFVWSLWVHNLAFLINNST